MIHALTHQYPSQYESHIKLNNGEDVFLRPIAKSDRYLIVDLFNKMSPQSVYLRFLHRFKTLPESMINRLIDINYHTNFALAATVRENGKDAIIAVGRYGYDHDEGIIDLAIAVRDDWQQIGLGETMLIKVINIAKDHGISHFTSMIAPENNVIKKLLRKLGHKVKYYFQNGFYKVEIVV
ncbi:GNAT family N-acetyltransferase [Desulfonema magnum]|uniref:GNAT domain-containing protein n=1 Tax=Desulfonema magnum TaxID=45655 RepID=A0A975BTB2_9BACT|nr:GNAT family N-acetyltransferase [Desulfonema magnum]QTA91265.1 GNAT domain-containing protein [Desulfonema magnum]